MIVVASAFVAAAADAQNIRFWLPYQDANSAALNGKSVGDELSSTFITVGLKTFTVGIMATAVADGLYGAGGVMLAFDTVTTNGTGKYVNKFAWNAATKVKAFNMVSLGTSDWTASKGLPGVDANGNDIAVDVKVLGSPSFSGSAGSGTSHRVGGVWAGFYFGTGKRLKLTNGQTFLLYKANMSIDQNRILSAADGAFVGVGLFALKNASSRTTYLGTTIGSGQGTSIFYKGTVPEPSSVIAVAAGLFALVARRRK